MNSARGGDIALTLIFGIIAAVCALMWLSCKACVMAVLAWASEKGLEPNAEEIKRYLPQAWKEMLDIK